MCVYIARQRERERDTHMQAALARDVAKYVILKYMNV